jgi:hypothetical protein
MYFLALISNTPYLPFSVYVYSLALGTSIKTWKIACCKNSWHWLLRRALFQFRRFDLTTASPTTCRRLACLKLYALISG